MNAFNHFASLIAVSFLTGYIIGIFVSAPYATPLALLVGGVIGLNWSKVTGFKLDLGGKNDER
jgi:hypothetical protein